MQTNYYNTTASSSNANRNRNITDIDLLPPENITDILSTIVYKFKVLSLARVAGTD